LRWQAIARGQDARPLVREPGEERFEETFELEWPVEELQPLSFVLARMLDPLCERLKARDRGADVLHIRLRLTTRELYARSLRLPAPFNDSRTLRTLLLLDLESHPPPGGIDRVTLLIDPAPAQIVQGSLLQRTLPSPEDLSTLQARLDALMGEGRCGAPVAPDTWEPGACAVVPFASLHARVTQKKPPAPGTSPGHPAPGTPRQETDLSVALRRFREPLSIHVVADRGRPVRVSLARRGMAGGDVLTCAGPWRTSGAWWHADASDPPSWDRDEWDVALPDGLYRIHFDRLTGHWFLEGAFD
jgi:protein ImuB